MDYLHLELNVAEKAGWTCWNTTLQHDVHHRKVALFHELDRSVPWDEHRPVDGLLFTTLLYACSIGKTLRVHGPLSRTAMRNVEELQLAWCRWRPSLYRHIEIVPDRIVDVPAQPENERAIVAFSGGVDSAFTLLTHTRLRPASTAFPVAATLTIHGFDVEIYNYGDFRKLQERIDPLLQELGVEPYAMRTNSRELGIQRWGDSHGLQLAGCLHLLSGQFRHGLIASSEPYDALSIPTGSGAELINPASSPVTDHLMSGGGFSIVHDGAGHSRTEKVAAINQHEIARRTLHVCWAGADQAGNCGRCEKCVRTRLNFLAAGIPATPECFDSELDIELIAGLEVHSACQFIGLKSALEHAERHAVKGSWLQPLRAKVQTWHPPDLDVRQRAERGNGAKVLMAKAVTLAGLEQPAKATWRRLRRGVMKRAAR